MKEIELIRMNVGDGVATQIAGLLRVIDKLPTNACALAIHPCICVDKRLRKHNLPKRVFILVHEYVHLHYQHGQTACWLAAHPKLNHLKKSNRAEVALWAIEEWANSKTKQLLGYAPKGLKVQPLTRELRGIASMRRWLVKRAMVIGSDPAHVKVAVRRIRHSYTTQ